MKHARKAGLSGNALKLIAITAMTVDHLTWVIFPGYQTNAGILVLHSIGRLTAPIMCYFIAEGYYYTHDRKRYAARLFLFALISHFAYNFAFGIPFVPFRTGIFNQTGVMWALAWGLAALCVLNSVELKQWHKTGLMILICAISFCADWSCIAVLVIVAFGTNRGNFKKQVGWMMAFVTMYAAVYFFCIDKVYGALQMMVALSIPLLSLYNGERGRWRGMKWFFYLYYPLHLVACGLIRIALHGAGGVLGGGI